MTHRFWRCSGSRESIHALIIDVGIKNAIIVVREQNTYARLKGSADLLEDGRKRALALLDSGESLNEVGRRIGCNPSSVMRWRDARRRGGAKALRVRFSP